MSRAHAGRFPRRARWWLCWVFILLLAGCLAESDRDNVDEEDTTDDGGGGPSDTSYYYDSDIAPIFEAKCGGAVCHESPPGYGGTVSLTGSDYAAIVDMAAPQNDNYKLIDTAQGSELSYIYMKIQGTSGISGGRMAYLTDSEVETLRDWIDQDPPAPETAP